MCFSFCFGLFIFLPQLHRFLCFLIWGGMKEGSQLTIAVSKSFKMVRCPFCLFEGHRILYECFPYWRFSNHKMFSCYDILNSLSSCILLCFFHYVVCLSFLWGFQKDQCHAEWLSVVLMITYLPGLESKLCIIWHGKLNSDELRILSVMWAKFQSAREENVPVSFSSGCKNNVFLECPSAEWYSRIANYFINIKYGIFICHNIN